MRSSENSPILVNSLFILNCSEKAELFTDFFLQQCKPVINDSVLPNFHCLTNARIKQSPQNNFLMDRITVLSEGSLT